MAENRLVQKMLPFLLMLLGVSFAATTTNISITDLVIVLLGLIIGWRTLVSRSFGWITSPLEHKFLIIFAALVVLSILFLGRDLFIFGATTLYLIGLFFVVRKFHHRWFKDVILSGYRTGAVGVSFLGVGLALFFQSSSWWHDASVDGKLKLFFSDPQLFGAFLIPAILLTISRLIDTVADNQARSIYFVLAATILLSALLLTGSIGALMQLIVALTIFVCLSAHTIVARFTHLAKPAVVMIVTISGVAFWLAPERIPTEILPSASTFSAAAEHFGNETVKTFLIGSGNGSFDSSIAPETERRSVYLRILVENGVAGLVFWIGFITVIIWRVLSKPVRTTTENAVLASVFGILFHSLITDTLHWRHFWLFLALL